jgi:glycosyltransferase involved in cell wall biosynthesis
METDAAWPDVSVVIPVYNGERTIGRCLSGVLAQDYKGRFEVLVVDNGSTDRTVEIVSAFGGCRLAACRRPGVAAARNTGIDAAQHSLIAFTDADCIPSPTWLRELVKCLGPEVDAVGGPLPGGSHGPLPDFVASVSFNQEQTMADSPPYIITANSLFRRRALLRVGKFDETFPIAGGEDNDLGWRLHFSGAAMRYVPSAICTHEHPVEWLDFLSQRVRYGYGTAMLIDKYRPTTQERASRLRDWWFEWRSLCETSWHLLKLFIATRERRQLIAYFSEVAFFGGKRLARPPRRAADDGAATATVRPDHSKSEPVQKIPLPVAPSHRSSRRTLLRIAVISPLVAATWLSILTMITLSGRYRRIFRSRAHRVDIPQAPTE